MVLKIRRSLTHKIGRSAEQSRADLIQWLLLHFLVTFLTLPHLGWWLHLQAGGTMVPVMLALGVNKTTLQGQHPLGHINHVGRVDTWTKSFW